MTPKACNDYFSSRCKAPIHRCSGWNFLWITLLAIGLPSCATSSTKQSTKYSSNQFSALMDTGLANIRLPKINHFKFHTPPETKSELDLNQLVLFHVTRLAFSNQANLLIALSKLQTIKASKQWRANGLAVGMLPLSQLPDFLANLPPSQINQWQRIYTKQSLAPITLTQPTAGPSTLNIQTGKFGRSIHLPKGQYRFLLQIQQATPQAINLKVIPQHHHVPFKLFPLTPEQRIVSGMLFYDLAAQVNLTTENVLVIALAKQIRQNPTPGTPGTPGNPGNNSAKKSSPKNTTTASPDSIITPNSPTIQAITKASTQRLGDKLMLANHWGKQVQLLILVSYPKATSPAAKPKLP